MKPDLILQADILDIIFEGRNKEYGAYSLRKEYNGRMHKAMFGVLILAAGIFIVNTWSRSQTPETSSGSIIVIDSIVIAPPPVSKPDPVEPPKQKIASIRNPTFILTNDAVTDTIPAINELDKDVQIGLKTENGIAAISDAPPPDQGDASPVSKPSVEGSREKDEILHHSQFMPEFPGGEAAFVRFLSKNLRVPDNALDPGQRIKILVRFVVGREGEILNIRFLESSGEVFEHEVRRVLNKMPKWKPGIQNGEKVQVYFSLPVIFDVPE